VAVEGGHEAAVQRGEQGAARNQAHSPADRPPESDKGVSQHPQREREGGRQERDT